MLLGIPIFASGNMTLESGLRDCVLGSSWFMPLFTISASKMGWMLGWIQSILQVRQSAGSQEKASRATGAARRFIRARGLASNFQRMKLT
jgi:hypothetical protein